MVVKQKSTKRQVWKQKAKTVRPRARGTQSVYGKTYFEIQYTVKNKEVKLELEPKEAEALLKELVFIARRTGYLKEAA